MTARRFRSLFTLPLACAVMTAIVSCGGSSGSSSVGGAQAGASLPGADAAVPQPDAATPLPGSGSTSAQPGAKDEAAVLQAIADGFLAEYPETGSLIAQVENPARRLLWSGAAGVIDRTTAVPADTNSVFRVASITKIFVATAVFRLSELGRLGIDDPVARHLSPETVSLLRERGYEPELITVAHLLAHTSGVPDYDTDDFVRAILADPDLRWTRREQLIHAFDRRASTGAPGERFIYSNNGYNLLGEIIEQKSSSTLGAALRELIEFDRLGLVSTWLEATEPAPAGLRFAHAYSETGRDLRTINASADAWGAGGLVSSVGDLNRFIRALLEARIVSPQSLAAMQVGAGPGLGKGLFNLPLGDQACWGHEGYLGGAVYYCTNSGLSLASTINFAFFESDGASRPGLRNAAFASRLFEQSR